MYWHGRLRTEPFKLSYYHVHRRYSPMTINLKWCVSANLTIKNKKCLDKKPQAFNDSVPEALAGLRQMSVRVASQKLSMAREK